MSYANLIESIEWYTYTFTCRVRYLTKDILMCEYAYIEINLT